MTLKRWPGLALLTLCLGAAHAASLPGFAQVRASHRPSDVQILDRHGVPIQTVRVDKQVRRLPWVALQDVSPAMRMAIVMSEDQRFWQHSGVDWRAVAASAWGNVWNQRTRGASTVTMQLAGLLDQAEAPSAGRRNWPQKLGQAWSASQLDQQWRKSEILEAYLNLVPFRGELVGLPALTQTLFHKHPDGLDAQEAAITAALVRGPNALQAVVAKRACQILSLQSRPCTGVDLLTASVLSQKGGAMLGEQIAPHLARQVLGQVMAQGPGKTVASAQAAPRVIRTTLDARWQRLAQSLLRQHLLELSQRDVEDGAVIVLDNASGDVLAWVGGSGDLSDSPQVDAVLARRQPGSTLKPFVYELAFEQRLLTPASLLHDAPVQLPTGAGLYIPQNYDKRFKGWVSVRTALGNSLNVPAVRAGAMLGPDALAQRLNQLGLALKEPGGFYGPGLALGSAEVSLRDLSNAYRSLANGGTWSPVRLRADAPPSPRRAVLDPAASYLVTDMLADNTARALTFGLSSVLATHGFAAVKTGTSKDMRDNWAVGWSQHHTVGVWVGNASGAPMRDVSGTSGAAPVWAEVMAHLQARRPSRPPTPPPGLVRLAVRFDDRLEAAREEWFLAGTEQAVFTPHGPSTAATASGRTAAAASAPSARRIAQPADGSIVAVDPDIPPDRQRVRFEASGGSIDGDGLRWRIDGRPQARGAGFGWLPWPGRHVVELTDDRGRTLDRIRLEVRGAGVRAADAGRPAPAPR